MTTISEIASAADVTVESVLHVLNRDEVSKDIAARVISAMDAYGYSRLPRPETLVGREAPDPPPPAAAASLEARPTARAVVGEVVDDGRKRDVQADDALGRAREQLLQAVGEVANELEDPETLGRASDPLGPSRADRMSVIDARLERVVRDIEEMKRELARARSERLEDLTLLVDLITTSWRTADRRLAGIDRKLERMGGVPEPSDDLDDLPRAERRGEDHTFLGRDH
jgi:hypothetical protein